MSEVQLLLQCDGLDKSSAMNCQERKLCRECPQILLKSHQLVSAARKATFIYLISRGICAVLGGNSSVKRSGIAEVDLHVDIG